MTLYKYKAKNKEGSAYERTLDVKNRSDLYNIIRGEGGSVISIQEVNSFMSSVSLKDIFGGIKTHQKITFAKNLGLMMNAGLPVTRALSVMGKQSRNRSFKKLLSDLEMDVSHGKTLSESLGRWPKIFSALLFQWSKLVRSLAPSLIRLVLSLIRWKNLTF